MDLTAIEPFLDWLKENPQWLLWALGITAFAESLALVGIVLPGVVMLFGIALLAGTSDIPLLTVLIWGALGAVVGDNTSYLLGRYCHGPIIGMKLFRQNPQWIDNGEAFFEKHGIISVVIGRFVGPIRPVLPLVAGMMEMPAWRFFTVNLLSALAWAPVYLLPGYLSGAGLEHIVTPDHWLYPAWQWLQALFT